MVCVAAFIILALIGVFVAVISIFKPKIGKVYWKMFKKAWSCLWKKVRLQKCETGFKDDIKNTILSRIIVKHPKLVKPLSVVIEILSVIIVIIAVWAILTAIKSLLALWTLGTCNVTKPAACTLGTEVCSIDEEEPKNVFEATGRWFTEWGEIFEAIPDKFKTYKAEDYYFNYIVMNPEVSDKPIALDILDPGCSVCLKSYLNQKESGFFNKYEVRLVPFAIQDVDGNYKFRNSGIIVRYLFATEQLHSGLARMLLEHIFEDRNEDGTSYQILFNEDFTESEVINQIKLWLNEAGLDEGAIEEINKVANYPETTDKMNENHNIVKSQLKLRGIPTMIYDGKKYTGLFGVD